MLKQTVQTNPDLTAECGSDVERACSVVDSTGFILFQGNSYGMLH